MLSADVIEFDSFAREVIKTAHPTGITVMGAYSLAISDNMLVFVTINPSSFVSVVDIDTGNTLLECGSRGRGPGEFLNFNTQKQFVTRDGHLCLWVYDPGMKDVLWDITESIEQQRFISLESWSFGEKYRQNNGILILPTGDRFVKFPVTYDDPRDNHFFYPRYAYFSSSDEEIKALPFFKKGDGFSVSGSDYNSVHLLMFNGLLRMKPDATKAIDAFFHAEHINFLDFNKNRGVSMSWSPGLTVDEIASASISEITQKYVEVYRDAAVTDDYVWALYSGKSGAEAPPVDSNVKSTIRIFDWEGTPLTLVRTDRELISIAYDRRTKRLYALDLEENVVYYELNDVI